MTPLDAFLSRQLERGRITFTREDALRTLPADSLTAALSQLIRKGRIANPRHGFYLILRPQDEGAPDPAQWIHPLMKHQKIDYRISLLSAAKFHGATAQATALQLIVPRPLRDFAIGRHKLEFINQPGNSFARTNRPEWLAEMKSGSSIAKAAGVELTLLDCARWFHKAGGISQVAQVTRDLGAKSPRPQARPARARLRELRRAAPRLPPRARGPRAAGEGARQIRAGREDGEAPRPLLGHRADRDERPLEDRRQPAGEARLLTDATPRSHP
jgi:hypothetical protein